MESMEEVAHLVRECTDCPLYRGRTNAVPGEGNANSEVMFIGEGPGYWEDREGRPFVGRAGQLLEGLLASIGTNRNEVFIANMVKCRPPDNRDPVPAEIAACSKYLDRQIELINPKVIVTLGRFSLGRFFPGESITRARGKPRVKDGRTIFPVLHPAAALRRTELRKTLVDDFRTMAQVVQETDRPALEPRTTPATQDQASDRSQPLFQFTESGLTESQLAESQLTEPALIESDTAPADIPVVTSEAAAGPAQLNLF